MPREAEHSLCVRYHFSKNGRLEVLGTAASAGTVGAGRDLGEQRTILPLSASPDPAELSVSILILRP